MEVISSIEEVFEQRRGEYCANYDGFHVHTNKQTIKLGIDNDQSCCESWGYFISNDDTNHFVGAEVLGIEIVDTCLNARKFDIEVGTYGLDCGGVMYVNIFTSRGTLQFTAYNGHNGYYGHAAFVKCDQLNHEETL
jgi:hypothetical protein